MTTSRLQALVSTTDKEIEIRRGDGSLLLTHRFHPGSRPSIHPIIAPDGAGVLTQDSPSHHPWQHGLYTGFNLVNGIGFWREQPEDGSFHPLLAAGPAVIGATARWSLQTSWRDPAGSPLIDEAQEWTLVDDGETFDLDLNWTLNAEVDVEIGQFMAGGLFLRMPYDAATGGMAVNSAGQRNGEAEKQRAHWVAVHMPIAGRTDWAGFVIMDHPANPAFPVTWRVDNELGLSPSRCIAESWSIAAGTADRYRYRLHAFCGELDSDAIDARWQAFSAS